MAEEISLSSGSTSATEHQQYFATVRELLSKVVAGVKNGNYEQADQYAITAYLDNYEYLEVPIEEHYPELMLDIEMEMREELRAKIQEEESPEACRASKEITCGFSQ